MPSHANPVNWFEIPVNDLARAKTFYESILGVEIVETEIAVDDPRRRVRGQIIGKPVHQLFHLDNLFVVRRSVLLRPAPRLAGNISRRFPEIPKSRCSRIDGVVEFDSHRRPGSTICGRVCKRQPGIDN